MQMTDISTSTCPAKLNNCQLCISKTSSKRLALQSNSLSTVWILSETYFKVEEGREVESQQVMDIIMKLIELLKAVAKEAAASKCM